MALESVAPLMFESLGHQELLVLRGTSREFRALASEDHVWADALRLMLDHLQLGQDELKSPAYPARARGDERDPISFFPCEAERVELEGLVLPKVWRQDLKIRVTSEGILEDMLHPESEDWFTPRTEVYKARPLPLRCELCEVHCDSYASFTEHCIQKTHKVMLDPSKRFDPRFSDPRFQDPRHGDGYVALSTMAKFEVMHRYREFLLDFFRESMAKGGWENIGELTDMFSRHARLHACQV
jgi:hypothetical protein